MNVNADELQSWLIERVATYCREKTSSIDPNVNFSSYGLDSVFALSLVGDIEDYLGFELETTVIWDYPSIFELVNQIESQVLVLAK